MKAKILLILATLAIAGLVGCQNATSTTTNNDTTDPIVGTWTFVSSTSANGTITSAADQHKSAELTFKKDNTVTYSLTDSHGPSTTVCSWTKSGSAYQMTTPYGTVIALTLSGNTLTKKNAADSGFDTFTK